MDTIEKNNNKVNEYQEHNNIIKNGIVQMKRTAKNFDQRNCTSCEKELTLPTVHFMCGHTYHEYCVESEGVRKCTKCYLGK